MCFPIDESITSEIDTESFQNIKDGIRDKILRIIKINEASIANEVHILISVTLNSVVFCFEAMFNCMMQCNRPSEEIASCSHALRRRDLL